MEKSEKIETALNMLNNNLINKYPKFFKIYPFSTENLSVWMSLFDFTNKTFLTVGSSCDQVINASYLGSNQQTVIDINPFAKEYFYLKKAGIMALNRSDYLIFFCLYNYGRNENMNVFNSSSFEKMTPFLIKYDYNSYLFWKIIFEQYNGKTIKKNLFLSDEERCCPTIQKMNLYLNDDNAYLKTKKALQNLNVEFFEADIYQYDKWKNYDNINLSNLGQYASNMEELYKYRDFVCNLINHLNIDGSILVTYLFGTTKNDLSPINDCSFISPIYNLPSTIELFQNYAVKIFEISSVKELVLGDRNSPDKVMILRKK